MRETLHEDEDFEILLVADDDGLAVELESRPSGPDLSDPDEVVVVIDGRGCPLQVDDATSARALIAERVPDEPEPMTLMVRIYEFFDGWDLFV